MTVLTNRKGALPLQRGQSVALIGRHALETVDMGGGSAQVNPPYQTSVAQGLRALLGEHLAVIDGVEVRKRLTPARPQNVSDPDTGQPGVEFTVLGKDGAVLERRLSSSATTMIGFDDGLQGRVGSVRVRARVHLSGPNMIGTLGVGQWELTVGDLSLQYDLTVSGGGFGEEILAPPTRATQIELVGGEVVEATVVPRGEGPFGSGTGTFGLIARSAPRDPAEVIAVAARTAAAADVAVVVVGLTEEHETESVDKDTLHLPGQQDDLVRAVAAAAKQTVVVVNAATPVIMPWRDEVDAVLWAGLPGQEGGHAIAAALLGDIEPSGRLVTTFPVADGAAPAWSVTPLDGQLEYNEGPFIGYRGHAAGRAPQPAFWFGHGLGYSTWKYSDATVQSGDASPTVLVTVTNTGSRPSREVVQVYFQPADSRQPVRLVGWAAVTAAPGESKRVRIHTDPRMWRCWDVAKNTWIPLEPGGELLIARGLGDIHARLNA